MLSSELNVYVFGDVDSVGWLSMVDVSIAVVATDVICSAQSTNAYIITKVNESKFSQYLKKFLHTFIEFKIIEDFVQINHKLFHDATMSQSRFC